MERYCTGGWWMLAVNTVQSGFERSKADVLRKMELSGRARTLAG